MNYLRLVLRLLKSCAFVIQATYSNKKVIPNAIIIVNNKLNLKYWLVSDPGLKDRIAYRALKEQGYSVSVLFNPDDQTINSQPKNALVWVNPHHFMFSGMRRDGEYKNLLHNYIKHLSLHFRFVVPPADDIKYWENKIYMHRMLEKLSLRHPNTTIQSSDKNIEFDSISFPVIVKTEDGYSSNGLWYCKSVEDLPRDVVHGNNCYLIQEFLNITFDIRVICVYGKVVSFYWRRNPKHDEWKPTATQNGATVQFVDLPASAQKLAAEIYEKTGCITYGADICFRNDDLDTEPYILEFSPVYQPNPTPPNGLVTMSYSKFKKDSVYKYDHSFEKLVEFIFSNIIVGDRMRVYAEL